MQTNEVAPNPQTTNTLPATETPTSLQPLVNKKYLIGFVILLLGIIGVLAFQNYQLKQQILQKQPASLPESTKTFEIPSPIPAVDPTENWKTYSNSVYGFSFKYPPSWSVETDPQVYQNWDQAISIFSSKEMPEAIGQIWIWKQNVGGKAISLQEFLNKPPQGGFQEYTKDGYPIYKAVEDKDKEHGITLVFEKSSRVFQIAFTISKNNNFEENTLLVNEIANSLTLR